MSDKPALQAIVGDYYSNILLLDPHDNPLTTISTRRAKWYLDKGLGASLGPENGYVDRIKLNFEPKNKSSNAFLQAILPTQCVVCGSVDNLTLHHVIPMAIKRFFPPEEKEHTRQWCVLVCETHHLEAEKHCRPLYEKSLQEAVKRAQSSDSDKNKVYHKLINMMVMQNLYIDKVQELLSPEEQLLVEGSLIRFKTDEAAFEAVQSLLKHLRLGLKNKVKQAKVDWGQRFIIEQGGIEALKTMFRDSFLILNPKFLPEGFLVDYENLC